MRDKVATQVGYHTCVRMVSRYVQRCEYTPSEVIWYTGVCTCTTEPSGRASSLTADTSQRYAPPPRILSPGLVHTQLETLQQGARRTGEISVIFRDKLHEEVLREGKRSAANPVRVVKQLCFLNVLHGPFLVEVVFDDVSASRSVRRWTDATTTQA